MTAVKAVILAESLGSAEFPFSHYFPKLGFSVANEPLIYHLVHHLQVAGVREIAVSVREHSDLFHSIARRINRHPDLGVQVWIVQEEEPVGTAGALRSLKEFIGDSTALVLTSSAFISGQDLGEVIRYHQAEESALTAVVERCGPGSGQLENFKLHQDGGIAEYIALHQSRDRRDPARCFPREGTERRECMCNAGIYVVSRAAVEMIPSDAVYMDINEQLVPKLKRAGLAARALPVEGPLPKITGLRQYFEANRRILTKPGEDQDFVFRNSREISEGVWVGEGVEIEPSARLTGPVLIGDNCRIGRDVTIIGPVAIGSDSYVDDGARVEESFIAPAARIGKLSVLSESLVAGRGVVRKGENVHRSFVVNAKDLHGGLSLVPIALDDGFKVVLRHGRFVPAVRRRRQIYRAFKRSVDVMASTSMLVVLSPVMGAIAAAIKMQGDGSVFYSQPRCGKGGREFEMYKFRTMVEGAHDMQQDLKQQKDVDGPMFKLENDPRVTRLGRFLRDTSLDELPQLVNVFKGEMSLVGPRPLIMQEMDFAPSWRDIRLQVTPGITGLWQVNGRHKVSFHDWIKNDIRYVKERSVSLDTKILLSTLKVLRNGKAL